MILSTAKRLISNPPLGDVYPCVKRDYIENYNHTFVSFPGHFAMCRINQATYLKDKWNSRVWR